MNFETAVLSKFDYALILLQILLCAHAWIIGAAATRMSMQQHLQPIAVRAFVCSLSGFSNMIVDMRWFTIVKPDDHLSLNIFTDLSGVAFALIVNEYVLRLFYTTWKITRFCPCGKHTELGG